MSHFFRRLLCAGVGLFDRVGEAVDDLVQRGERRRDGSRHAIAGASPSDAPRLAELEERVRQLELELDQQHQREEDANELLEALVP